LPSAAALATPTCGTSLTSAAWPEKSSVSLSSVSQTARCPESTCERTGSRSGLSWQSGKSLMRSASVNRSAYQPGALDVRQLIQDGEPVKDAHYSSLTRFI